MISKQAYSCISIDLPFLLTFDKEEGKSGYEGKEVAYNHVLPLQLP